MEINDPKEDKTNEKSEDEMLPVIELPWWKKNIVW